MSNEPSTPGAVVRNFRKASNLTVMEVAVACSVTEGAVRQWESDRSKPRRAAAAMLDQVTGANGEVMAALGYAVSDEHSDQLSRLTAMVARQQEQIDQLASQLAVVDASLLSLADLAEKVSPKDAAPARQPRRTGG